MPPRRENAAAHEAATNRDTPMRAVYLICARCLTGAEYIFDPADGEPLEFVCEFYKAGSGACDSCAGQNKVCQSVCCAPPPRQLRFVPVSLGNSQTDRNRTPLECSATSPTSSSSSSLTPDVGAFTIPWEQLDSGPFRKRPTGLCHASTYTTLTSP